MRFFRLLATAVLLLACVVLGIACAGAKGEEGPQGQKGDTGAAGVGVQNIVNNGNGTFTVNLTNGTAYTTDNFTGPKGEQGEQGVRGIQGPAGMPGVGVEWVGEWDNSVLYGKYDGVGYQGSSYISKQPNNTNHLPTDANWWDLWVEKGDTGSTGAPGADGQDGAPGPNMIVAMGTFLTTTLFQAYNVDSCEWDAALKLYKIKLTGMDYVLPQYVTMVTVLGPPNFHANVSAGSPSGLLHVQLYDSAYNLTQGDFCFMVLQVS